MQVMSQISATLVRQIGVGEGRNSEVFLAFDTQLNGHVALKQVPVSSFGNPTEYFREAGTLYANKHPRVLPVMYACHDSDYVRIAMPYYSNGSVNGLIATGSLTTRMVIEYGQNLLSGLHHVHSRGFVHFDVKPSNLLICDDRTVVLSDFGQSRMADARGGSHYTTSILNTCSSGVFSVEHGHDSCGHLSGRNDPV